MNSSSSLLRRRGGRRGIQVGLVVLFAIIGSASPLPGLAIDGTRTVSIGESNTEAQRAEVLELLNAAETDQAVTVTVDDTLETMAGVFDLSGVDTAYSSTALTCQAAGSGIDVMTRNIEVIPPELYALALLTAGMSDVQLAVAAPTDAPALGMTALTGVFRTWDMASCSGAGGDPARRQLALEELALIAEIGQEPEAVRQTTLVVLAAQQTLIEGTVTTDDLDAIVASESDAVGLNLGDADRAAIVAFLDRLYRADIAWGEFSAGWSTRYAADGSGVVMTANRDLVAPAPERDAPAGVGGVTGTIAAAPARDTPATPDVTPSPTATLILPPVSTPAPPGIGDDPGSPVLGTTSERDDHGLLRWWPVAVIGGAIAVLGFLVSRLFGASPMVWLVARRRTSEPARESRRASRHAAMSRTPDHIRRVRIPRESIRS